MTAGSRRRLTASRGLKLPTQSRPDETPEVPMPTQPQPPLVEMNDESLMAIWTQHKTAAIEAAALGQEAATAEQTMKTARDSARQVRDRIAELTLRAEADEDAAMAAEKLAIKIRQDEKFALEKAKQLLNAVNYLGSSNQLMHPAEREKRDAEIAAANAANALTSGPGPIDHLAGVGMDHTAPFKNAGEAL